MAKCAALLSVGLVCFLFWSSVAGRAGAAGELVQKRGSAQKNASSPAALFESKCARCHGNDGRGETAIGRIVNSPDMTDAEWWQKRTNNRTLIASVTRGRGGMPAFGKKLTQKEIASLVAYTRTFKQ